MTFSRDLDFHVDGIEIRFPPSCRHLDGMIADLWFAQGRAGASGYYLSPNPRIQIFYSDVGQSIRMANEKAVLEANGRPMGRAVYIPAGTPMWSRFTSPHQFQHLDIYIDQRALQNMLAPRLGRSAAIAALRNPVELDHSEDIEALADLAAREVADPRHHPLYMEGLIQSIAAGMLAPETGQVPAPDRLSDAQMRRLRNHVLANMHRRVSNAELADEARLSESWFSYRFKRTTGETPQQWQARLRIERAQDLLSNSTDSLCEVAQLLGFSDQSHLTRSFRSATGQTPAAWRRQHAAV